MTGFRSKPAPASAAPFAPGAVVAAASPAAQAGPAHVETPVAYDAVLLLGFGGPEGQDDVLPFLRNVTAGRGIPDERLEEVAHHYRHFGGISPINAQTRALADALQAELARRGRTLPVYLGNRNWAPYVDDALARIHADGHRRVLAMATSAYSSYSSCRQYREDVADGLAATGLGGVLEVDKVRQFFDHPGFVEPFVEGLRDALAQLRAEGIGEDEVEVLFSTHSIPVADADRSGPRDRAWETGGAYVAQHRAVAGVVMRRARARAPWQLVFQSRSGPAHVPWLEPDVNDVIAGLPAQGRRGVVIVPLGFVSDHMEVMWDLDTEARQTAAAHGLAVVRTATPGTHARYVSGLVDLLEERITGTPAPVRPHETALGPWYDTCRPQCCENTRRGFRPAVAGVAP